ncbi:acyl-CoA dehydrogenase family protein [Coxiella burnetii]|uniref:acyl-CoA dehydrogenase family protein n=1 Tax=Coxiella burnetii TaxID=777 RepID=UPI00222E735A|nr:acyl-CoA dehydrogenase family protein [Coxiella burnetii]
MTTRTDLTLKHCQLNDNFSIEKLSSPIWVGYAEKSASVMTHYISRDLDWSTITSGKATIQKLEGSHFQVLQKPYVNRLTEKIKAQFKKSLGASAPPAASTRQQETLEWIRNYASKKINSQLFDQRRCFPPYVILDIGNRGLLGFMAGKKYGGEDYSLSEIAAITEQLAAVDLSLCSFIGLNNALGILPIVKGANDEIKDRYLPLLASGRILAAFALTEPVAGSNPNAIQSVATPYQRNRWRLNGEKCWIGSGSWCGVLSTFVKIEGSQILSGFVIDANNSGLIQGKESLTMGMRGMVQNTLYFKDLVVHENQLLGEINQGMPIAQHAMMFARFGLNCMSIGALKRSLQLMMRYASKRSIKTGLLAANPLSMLYITNLLAAVYTLSALSRATMQWQQHPHFSGPLSITCKIFGPEFLGFGVDRLVQLLGGRGYIESNQVPQLFRDARLLRIFEGPTEMLLMYLGMFAVNFYSQLRELIQQLSPRLEISTKIAPPIKDLPGLIAKNFPQLNDEQQKQLYYLLLGKLTGFVILMACADFTEKDTQHYTLIKAWLNHQLKSATLPMAQFSPHIGISLCSDILLTEQEIAVQVDNFKQDVGDIYQGLPSEQWKLDDYLK